MQRWEYKQVSLTLEVWKNQALLKRSYNKKQILRNAENSFATISPKPTVLMVATDQYIASNELWIVGFISDSRICKLIAPKKVIIRNATMTCPSLLLSKNIKALLNLKTLISLMVLISLISLTMRNEGIGTGKDASKSYQWVIAYLLLSDARWVDEMYSARKTKAIPISMELVIKTASG